MADSEIRNGWELRLSPRALLLGAICSFLACCAAGHAVSRRNPFTEFERFHMFINPQTQFHPTVDQVRALARDSLDREKIAVIVGGSSIMHGAGQRVEHVWTKELQRQLGDEYRVLNLALASAGAMEFGGVAAEFLERDYPKLIFIASLGSSGLTEPDGYYYRYFYWQARQQGLLIDAPDRDNRLKQVSVGKDGELRDELLLEMTVDRLAKAEDLWTSLAYDRAATIWTPITGHDFWKARKHYSDPDVGDAMPFALRNGPDNFDARMAVVKSWADLGGAVFRGDDSPMITCLKASFPPQSRARTLLVILSENPYYVDRLPPATRDEYYAIFAEYPEHVERAGFASLSVGRDYTVDDYADLTHLDESGGRHLAADAAPKIKQMAHNLGYLPKKELP